MRVEVRSTSAVIVSVAVTVAFASQGLIAVSLQQPRQIGYKA